MGVGLTSQRYGQYLSGISKDGLQSQYLTPEIGIVDGSPANCGM